LDEYGGVAVTKILAPRQEAQHKSYDPARKSRGKGDKDSPKLEGTDF